CSEAGLTTQGANTDLVDPAHAIPLVGLRVDNESGRARIPSNALSVAGSLKKGPAIRGFAVLREIRR
ncbi:MAG: hypothetical protein P8I25_07075, partial [Ilumatobacter sp.]|nr:hypothetical protein [Ilumatobacter sp.]